MRKIITGAFVSLDGIMQSPGGRNEDPSGGFKNGGWVAPLVDEVFGEEVDKLLAGPFDLLLGRKTYDIFAAYWPFKGDGEYAAIAKSFNSATKYVATRSDMALAWDKSERLNDPAKDIPRLKQQNGPPLVTQGSSDLIQTLLANDLIDELRVFTFPLMLGRGKRLFHWGAKPAAFELTHSRVSRNGIVIATYARAGELKTADIDLDPPTPVEVDRRERLKRTG